MLKVNSIQVNKYNSFNKFITPKVNFTSKVSNTKPRLTEDEFKAIFYNVLEDAQKLDKRDTMKNPFAAAVGKIGEVYRLFSKGTTEGTKQRNVDTFTRSI